MLLNCKALTHDPKCKQDGTIRKTLALSPGVVVHLIVTFARNCCGSFRGRGSFVLCCMELLEYKVLFSVACLTEFSHGWSSKSTYANEQTGRSDLKSGVGGLLLWKMRQDGFFLPAIRPTVKCLKQVLLKKKLKDWLISHAHNFVI